MFKSTQIHRELLRPAQTRTKSLDSLKTLQDLLNAMRRGESENCHLTKMLGATTSHLALHLGLSPDKIEIEKLQEVRPGLQLHLKEQGFRPNSIRSYCNYVRIFLQKAKELGWTGYAPELVRAWQVIRRAVAKSQGCVLVVAYAIRKGKDPSSFTEADLDEYGQAAVLGAAQIGQLQEWQDLTRNPIAHLVPLLEFNHSVKG